MITSNANKGIRETIQLMQKPKARKEKGLFVAEGVKMFLEAPTDRIEKVYLAENASAQLSVPCKQKLAKIKIPYETVTDDIFRKMSDTKTPQGILCVLRQYRYDLEAMLKTPAPLFLLLEDIQDPGNLGTIFRAGEGAGITGVIMSGSTVDIYNPKTIRATMGSIYRVPFLYTPNLPAVIEKLTARDITVYAAHLQGEKIYDACDCKKGTAFLIGNESGGLREETVKKAAARIKIPLSGEVESLNAAIAAAVLMFEAARQRQ